MPAKDENPGQGAFRTVGAAGLSPGVSSSVEPSGTAPLSDPGVKPAIVEPVTDVAAPGEPDAPDVQSVAIVEVDIVPPPSKLELDPTVAAVPKQGVVLAVGLSPAELSSVAPSGIPPGMDSAFENDGPSGDVAPIPAVALTCAKPTSQRAKIIKAAPAVVRARHMEASISLVAAKLGAVCDFTDASDRFSKRLRWCLLGVSPVALRNVAVNELVSLNPIAASTPLTELTGFASNDLARSMQSDGAHAHVNLATRM